MLKLMLEKKTKLAHERRDKDEKGGRGSIKERRLIRSVGDFSRF